MAKGTKSRSKYGTATIIVRCRDVGGVVISSKDRKALTAIHQFLRFQIEEHKTGDSVEVR